MKACTHKDAPLTLEAETVEDKKAIASRKKGV
jgi:nitrite reductase/ring-hydroxylating ferredoxin subunit